VPPPWRSAGTLNNRLRLADIANQRTRGLVAVHLVPRTSPVGFSTPTGSPLVPFPPRVPDTLTSACDGCSGQAIVVMYAPTNSAFC
jgi:hypothetical protein